MTKRVESLRAPCLDASSTLATSTSKRANGRSFFVSVARSVNRWRFGRLVCVSLLFADAKYCLYLMIVFENKFSDIICQSQQSTITTASLRSPLNCGGRSTLGGGEIECCRCGRVSFALFLFRWLGHFSVAVAVATVAPLQQVQQCNKCNNATMQQRNKNNG